MFRIKNGASLDFECFEEIINLATQKVFIFVDDITEDVQEVINFIIYTKRKVWAVSIIGGARNNEWNKRCDDSEPLVDEKYDLKYLAETEIKDLLNLLEKHKCLGRLASLSFDSRMQKLKKIYGRQLLAALHEATENATFREIIFSEYKDKFRLKHVFSISTFAHLIGSGLL